MTTATPEAPPVTSPAAPAATPAPAPAGGFLGSPPPAGGAAPATPSSTPAPQAGGTPPAHFFDGALHEGGAFKEGWSENLRAAGFERLANKGALAKDEAGFLRSLDDALGLIGRKPVTYPGPTATEAEVAEYRRAAGVPDDPAGYTLKPDKLPEGVEWDDAGGAEFAGLLHKHHAPAALAKDLGEAWAQQQVKFREAAKDGFAKQVNELAAESARVFGQEWGSEASSRQQANADYLRSRGIDLSNPVLQLAFSHPDVVRIVDAARRGLREAPLPGVDAGVFSGSASPGQQARELMKANPRWKNDPELSKRISDLYALDATQAKRGGR